MIPRFHPRQLFALLVLALASALVAVACGGDGGGNNGAGGSLDDIAAHTRESRRFTPQMTPQERARLIASWEKAVERSLGWAI